MEKGVKTKIKSLLFNQVKNKLKIEYFISVV